MVGVSNCLICNEYILFLHVQDQNKTVMHKWANSSYGLMHYSFITKIKL